MPFKLQTQIQTILGNIFVFLLGHILFCPSQGYEILHAAPIKKTKQKNWAEHSRFPPGFPMSFPYEI
jgi:hypothetical protein